MLKKLWADEGGAIVSAELLLIMTIVVIGLTVGLTALKDAVVTELSDVAAAIGSLNQSYSTSGAQLCSRDCAWTAGSAYTDLKDQCELSQQTAGTGGPLGVVVCGIAATGEGT